MADQDKLISKLQNQQTERESEFQSQKMELDSRTRRVFDLEKKVAQLERNLQEREFMSEATKRHYLELADLLGASETQKQAFMVTSKVRALHEEMDTLKAAVAEEQKKKEKIAASLKEEQAKSSKLEKEVGQHACLILLFCPRSLCLYRQRTLAQISG
jgi:chromosome segregation ATPase